MDIDTHQLLLDVRAHLMTLGDEKSKRLAERCQGAVGQATAEESFLPMPKTFNRSTIEKWIHHGDLVRWRQWCERGPVNQRLAISAFGMAAYWHRGQKSKVRGTWVDGLDSLWSSPWAREFQAKMLGEVASRASHLNGSALAPLAEWISRSLPKGEGGKPVLTARNRLLWALLARSVEVGDEDTFMRLWGLGPNTASKLAANTVSMLVKKSSQAMVDAWRRQFSYTLNEEFFRVLPLPWAETALRLLVEARCGIPPEQGAMILVDEPGDSPLLDLLFSQGRAHYGDRELAQFGLIGGIMEMPETNWERLVAWLIDMRVPEKATIGERDMSILRQAGGRSSDELILKGRDGGNLHLPRIRPEDGGIAGGGFGGDGSLSFRVGPYLFFREDCSPDHGDARLRARLIEGALATEAGREVPTQRRPRM